MFYSRIVVLIIHIANWLVYYTELAIIHPIKNLISLNCNYYAYAWIVHTHNIRMDGQLEFYDTSELNLITTAEHTQATDLEWDPSGRYIVTSVSYWTQKVPTHLF